MKKGPFALNREQVCRLIGIVAMMVWAVVMVWFYGSGRIQHYIRPEYLRLACLLGGLGLGLVSVFNLLHLRDGEGCEECGKGEGGEGEDFPGEGHAIHHHHEQGHHGHDHHHPVDQGGHVLCEHGHAGCDHGHEAVATRAGGVGEQGHGHAPTPRPGHEHDEWDTSLAGNVAMFLVMVVPLLAAAAYSKDEYRSANTIWNKGFVEDTASVARRVGKDFSAAGATAEAKAESKEDSWEYTLADLEKVVDRSQDGYLLLTVDQLFYTSGDAELRRILEGEAVETVGQVIPYDPKVSHPSRLRVFTLMVTCCAADAQPVSIPVEFAGGVPSFEEMSWVKVSGTMRYAKEEGQTLPVLMVKTMGPTEQPYSDAIY